MTQSLDDCFAYDRALIPVQDAIDRLRSKLVCLAEKERQPLDQCLGRYLSEPLIAPRDVPAFDNVAVDGWAVAWTANMANHRLNLPIQPGRAAAGHPHQGRIKPSQVLRVLTGAILPQGADTVILQEECAIHANHVTLPSGIKRGANCRPAGEDIQAGSALFAPGAQLRAQDLGAAALMGIADLPVFKPLKVAVFSTGDEVIEPGQPFKPGAVFDANRPMLKARLQDLPVQMTDLGRLADDPQTIDDALIKAARSHDVVITSGGASQGDEDHIAQTIAQHGNLHFWRIALKPGRPMALGQIGRGLFVGLPGNPVAAFVCFTLFARPMLTMLGGGGWQEPFRIPVTVGSAIKKRPGRTEMVRARLEHRDQSLIAHKIAKQGSGVLTSLVDADGLLELGPELDDIDQGQTVPFIPF